MFEIIDSVDAELARRFSDNESHLIACETVNQTSALFLDSDRMKPLVDKYAYTSIGIDTTNLKAQCVVTKELFSDKTCENSCDVLKRLGGMKCGKFSAFPDLIIFVTLVQTLPVSSAQAERTFSSMKRVKNYLRTSICVMQDWTICV